MRAEGGRVRPSWRLRDRQHFTLDLHPLLILLATSLCGMVAGMIGLVLAAPALAITIDVQRELKAAGFFDDYE